VQTLKSQPRKQEAQLLLGKPTVGLADVQVQVQVILFGRRRSKPTPLLFGAPVGVMPLD